MVQPHKPKSLQGSGHIWCTRKTLLNASTEVVMKVVRIIVLLFYIVFVIPMCAIMIGSLAYGGIVETIKTLKKQ